MTRLRRPGMEFLQWFGLLGAALIWTTQHLVGFSVTLAACAEVERTPRHDVVVWQVPLMIGGILLALVSEAAAVSVFRETTELDHNDAAPWGRRHFFAAAAMVGNVLFVMAILLSGIGSIVSDPCQGA